MVMITHRITGIKIPKFRKFQNIETKVGSRITVVSGINAIGKSSLLSLIASSSGTPNKRLSGGNFQPEFMEYFKLSPDADEISGYEIFVDYQTSDNYKYRRKISFNDYRKDNRGIRVIPRGAKIEGLETLKSVNKKLKDTYSIGASARIPIPTIFVSLSRLFPVGESGANIAEKTMRSNNDFFTKGGAEKYKNWYNQVFFNSIQKDSAERFQKNGKNYFHMELADSKSETQSVGQDNLGFIISALIDFYILKKQDPINYAGGVLCIDEIDASLHPSAQIKLFNLLTEISGELNLQIFITTHSLEILRRIVELENENSDKFRLLYFLDPNIPHLLDYQSFDDLKVSLFEETTVVTPIVKVYVEDSIAVRLLNLLCKTAKNLGIGINLIEFKPICSEFGKEQLLKLPEMDSAYFNKICIIVDGDGKLDANSQYPVDESLIQNSNVLPLDGITPRKAFNRDNVLSLPSLIMPEIYLYRIIYSYANSASDHTNFWSGLSNISETRLLTSATTQQEIVLDKTDKKSIKAKADYLMDFAEKTQILKDYYSQENNKIELENFIENFDKALKAAEKSMKSGFYY
ncbi:AAA family ATPase [Lactovum odontotermitis]